MSSPTLVTPSSSTTELLAKLSHVRSTTQRCPLQVLQWGQALIERGWAKGNSDQVWTVLEQTATAALECGQMGLAQVLTSRLSTQFLDSPRVQVLEGSIIEAQGDLGAAREFYEDCLIKDEHNHLIRKRLISLHLSVPPSSSSALTAKGKSVNPFNGLSKQVGVDHLVEYLDSVYNDTEGWSQLARVYAGMGFYPQSLTALSHLLLLQPHSPYVLLQHAETAYTLGDVPLAYKEFLRVVEMSEGTVRGRKEGDGGVGRRAAMGVRLCLARLSSSASSSASSSDPLLRPKETKAIDLLTSKLILDAYASAPAAEGGAAERRAPEAELTALRGWIGGKA